MRHFRGSRGMRRSPRPMTRTFKKIIRHANASFSAGFQNESIAIGTDNSSPKQTTISDTDVPTGARLKYFEIQFAVTNVVSTPCFINCSVQYTLSGQTFIDPSQAGGKPQRNQILHMELYSVGANQNSTHKFRFKVPPKFQRLRESMQWGMTWSNTATVNRETQVIYKMEL